jgi:hypothetical protein
MVLIDCFKLRLEVLPLMLEDTGVCPYVDRCEDVRTLRRLEGQMIRERRGFFSQEAAVVQDGFNEALENYRRRLEGVGRAMERCRGSYRRCLRFWQLRKIEEDEAYLRPPMSGVAATARDSRG